MAVRGFIVAAVLALAGFGAATLAVEPGVKARMAGDGPEVTYFLGKDVAAGIVINQLHTLEFYKSQGEPTVPLGYHLTDVDAALDKVRKTLENMQRKGHVVSVVYNTPVTAVEKEQTVTYDMFLDTKIKFGRGYTATVIKIRVDDGPLKGLEYYARRIVDPTHVIATDHAWLRVPEMKAVPVSENAAAVARYWAAMAKNDLTASAQAYIDGNFTQLALNTECRVLRLSEDHLFAQIRAVKTGESHDYWVLATVASLEPPPK